jgi:two-component system chemotaxis response regulator CheB
MIATEPHHDRSWQQPERPFGVVVVAASAGGVHALRRILSELPAHFPIALVVAHQLWPEPPSLLARILGRYTPLEVKEAEDGDVLRPATVYTPAPGRHLRIEQGGILSVFAAERIQFVRPSADLLFQSAVATFGGRAIGVALTGYGRDGAQGIQAVRKSGGFIIAQDEASAENFEMPYAAIETRKVDLVLPLHHIGFALRVLVELPEVA